MGEVSLGNAKLNQNTITEYADILSSWDNYLESDGDILLYGCNVGAGTGAEFVSDLSQYTEADVLASTDLTGNKELGGDWDLELAVGEVAETTLFTAEIESSYEHILFYSGSSFDFALPDTFIDPSFYIPSADLSFDNSITIDPYTPPLDFSFDYLNLDVLDPSININTYDLSDPIINTDITNFTPTQIDFNSTDFDYSSLSIAANTISFGFEPTEFNSLTANFEFLSAINSPDAVGFAFEDYKFDYDSRFSFDADSVTIGSDTITFEYDPNSLDFSSADLFRANTDLFDYKFLDSEVSLIEGEIPFAEFNASDYRALEYAFVGDELFDPEYYLAQNIIPEGMNPFTHYIENGYPAGLDPNALFDVSYYLDTNPDVAISGIDPLQHYAQFGWKTGLDPSQFFDTSYYLELYDDVRIESYQSPGANPLQHYREFGLAEGRVTHELFEAENIAKFTRVITPESDPQEITNLQKGLEKDGYNLSVKDDGSFEISQITFIDDDGKLNLLKPIEDAVKGAAGAVIGGIAYTVYKGGSAIIDATSATIDAIKDLTWEFVFDNGFTYASDALTISGYTAIPSKASFITPDTPSANVFSISYGDASLADILSGTLPFPGQTESQIAVEIFRPEAGDLVEDFTIFPKPGIFLPSPTGFPKGDETLEALLNGGLFLGGEDAPEGAYVLASDRDGNTIGYNPKLLGNSLNSDWNSTIGLKGELEIDLENSGTLVDREITIPGRTPNVVSDRLGLPREQTRGLFIDPNGNTIQLKSVRKDLGDFRSPATIQTEREIQAKTGTISNAMNRSFSDVEGNAASIVRQLNLSGGTVVINNEGGPCFNCIKAIPDILNPGQILEVIYTPDGGRTLFVDIFRGGKTFNVQTDRQRIPLDF
ncbi:DUF4347 domain-containing protein [Pleurocapsales cyanobacterium LEGE 10410]|nr:DUF4347 domain-containing protein [Pleurocapsales cyanobacterium LEGE 10410]